MGRTPCCDKSRVKRGIWSPEEDATLIDYLHKHGTAGNWITLPQRAGLRRCGKSCRLRWLNYLRPDIKHGGFTQEEENMICNLYNRIGSRWSKIASHLPGRTDNDVKNYWNTKLKKRFISENTNYTKTTTSSDFDKTAKFQASIDSLASSPSPTFPMPFSHYNSTTSMDANPMSISNDQPVNFHSPINILKNSSNCSVDTSTSIYNSSYQDSDFSSRIPSSCLMNTNDDVKSIPVPVEEYSYDVYSDICSQLEATGGENNADLFSIFNVYSKPQGISQNQ